MKRMKHFVFGFGMAVTALLTSCNKELEKSIVTEDQGVTLTEAGRSVSALIKIFKGPPVRMGNGTARSWISMTQNDLPLEIGVEMTPGTLSGLPTDPEDFAASEFRLALHQKAKGLTAFDHIDVNWNVHGHEPAHVFDVPHFDFHFYMISEQEQMAIPPYPLAPAAHDLLPPANYWPSLYLATPGGVPQMGKHWIDLTFTPPFTSTMIYGSYNGKFTFLEPMATYSMIDAGLDFSQPFRQMNVFSPTGKYYPTIYNIYKDDATGNRNISLSSFVFRN